MLTLKLEVAAQAVVGAEWRKRNPLAAAADAHVEGNYFSANTLI